MFLVKALGRLIVVGLSPLGVVVLSILAFWQFFLLVGCAVSSALPCAGLAGWLLGLAVSWFILSFWLVLFQLVFCWLFVSVCFRGFFPF